MYAHRLQILARTWREQNPDWEYHLWNGEEMDELVEKHFPEYLSLYRSFSYNVQRWDTIRYMILYVYGGVIRIWIRNVLSLSSHIRRCGDRVRRGASTA